MKTKDDLREDMQEAFDLARENNLTTDQSLMMANGVALLAIHAQLAELCKLMTKPTKGKR